MSLAIQEMYRVIRQGRAVVIVVGPSTMRGLKIDTHDHLAAIATEIGFDVVRVVSRPIDRDKRMMPARWQNNGQSVIEQRMHEEFVLGLIKP
jgi:3-oxoacyl-(acyl-carrier-protein) synthase